MKIIEKLYSSLTEMLGKTQDEVTLEEYLRTPLTRSLIEVSPFPHMVVDNLLHENVYQKIVADFEAIKKRGYTKDTNDGSRFHCFDIDYDGYLFTPEPSLSEDHPLRLFYSMAWQSTISKLFNQKISYETAVAYHHHPPGDSTGFVHHDFSFKFFDKRMRLKNFIIPKSTRETDTVSPFTIKRRRAIAIIFYLNNNRWAEGDGGETGLYLDDKTTQVKKVAPINNRILIFQISKKSMHAFQKNMKERNCIVQWFHNVDEEKL